MEPVPPPLEDKRPAERVGYSRILGGRLVKMATPGVDAPVTSAASYVSNLLMKLGGLLEANHSALHDLERGDLEDLLKVPHRRGRERESRRDLVRAIALRVLLAGPALGLEDCIKFIREREERLLDFLEEVTPCGARILGLFM